MFIACVTFCFFAFRKWLDELLFLFRNYNTCVIRKCILVPYKPDSCDEVDVTEEVIDHFKTHYELWTWDKFGARSDTHAHLEIRYTINFSKYRIVKSIADPSLVLVFPVTLKEYAKAKPHIVRAWCTDTGQDITDRVRKYYGPNKDFHSPASSPEDFDVSLLYPFRTFDGDVRVNVTVKDSFGFCSRWQLEGREQDGETASILSDTSLESE